MKNYIINSYLKSYRFSNYNYLLKNEEYYRFFHHKISNFLNDKAEVCFIKERDNENNVVIKKISETEPSLRVKGYGLFNDNEIFYVHVLNKYSSNGYAGSILREIMQRFHKKINFLNMNRNGLTLLRNINYCEKKELIEHNLDFKMTKVFNF